MPIETNQENTTNILGVPVQFESYEESKSKYGERFELVTKMIFLLGIEEKELDENKKLEGRFDGVLFNSLYENKDAKIIRDLCRLRLRIMLSAKNIRQKIKFENISLFAMPEYVPQDSLQSLKEQGIDLYGLRLHMQDAEIEINRRISERIENCRTLFPEWLKWEYVKDLFIMPGGMTKEGLLKEVNEKYYPNKPKYPYRLYFNWKEPSDSGNVFYNDEKFTSLLYHWNGDEFSDISKVKDIQEDTRRRIRQFFEDGEKITVVADCENSDPYALCAALKGMDAECLAKVSSIILYDDPHTSSAWDKLQEYVGLPVKHIEVERVTTGKSLVDGHLMVGICQEAFLSNTDSFVLAASDSDYWTIINALSDRKFLVLMERDKTGLPMKEKLKEHSISYCFLDDFYDGGDRDIRTKILLDSIMGNIHNRISINIKDEVKKAIQETRVKMEDSEIETFMKRRLKTWAAEVDNDWTLQLKLK